MNRDNNRLTGLDNNDGTIIKPIPGGRRTGAPESAVASPSRPVRAGIPPLPVRTGLNPLESAASALLALLTRLQHLPSHPDPEGLRNQVIEEVKTFESRALSLGAKPEIVVAARYVLCAALDDVVLNTPWGRTSDNWQRQGLLITFHKETWGGEKFFLLLDKLTKDPTGNLHLLELMYLCLALGFQGRYRVLDGGYNQLEELRERLFHTLRAQRGEFERELSPHWQGVVDRRNPLLRYVPLWVIATLAAVLLAALYIGFNLALNRFSDPVFAALHGLGKDLPIPADHRPPPPTLPPPPAQPKLQGFLEPEIRQGLVTVTAQADQTIIRLHSDNLFDPGSVVINATFYPLLQRIAEALKTVPGKVQVIGHTDNVPIHTVRFPSNWHLSRARAEAVLKLLAVDTGTPERFTAEGRADTEPLTSNDTPADRARNRRVEIILLVPAKVS